VADSGRVLATHVRIARRAFERMRGLLSSDPLRDGECLLLEPASQVHTFGMSVPIDVVFCDGKGVVVHVVRNMRPRRVTKWVRGARLALEFTAGAVPSEVVAPTRLAIYEEDSNGQ
jgi:uncharacterized protein